MDSAAAMLLMRWNANCTRDADGAPLIPPLFVAEQGPGVQIADVRARGEATGVLGYVPGSAFPGVDRLEQLAIDMDDATPLVLVCANGETSAAIARRLEEKGVQNIAAMAGGIAAWRALRLFTSRDPEGAGENLDRTTTAPAESGPVTLERVRAHMGDPRTVRWIQLASMLAHGRVSCIDGRDERGVIGSPGGDGGEFLLCLAAIERVTGRTLDDATVARGLLAHIDTFGDFYMHTDVHAFEALTDAMRADPRLEPDVQDLTRPDDWYEFLRTAAPPLRDPLLEHLLEPAHVGCGHIRLMLQHSEDYGTRRELVVAFLRAFFRLWWDGAPELTLTALPGDHDEGAVVNVRLAEDVWGLSRVPLVSPACGGQQMFVNHPDVSSLPLSVEQSQEAILQEAINALAAQQLSMTAGHLAKDLPMFDVIFSQDGSFVVRGP
ncbi:MAG: rhodanese-like domain-containing protein [Planctomycetota bacterium]